MGTNPMPTPPPADTRHSWYLVAILGVVSIFAFIDRQILSLLVQPVRRDLAISDTQMSLLLGFSFALFFTLFAIPIGRLADRRSRRGVLAAGLAGWSFCTAACGVARTFGQMMLLRMGVGLGEATLNPCAYSMIADSFPPDRRSTALSVYSMSMSIGAGLAYLAGGFVIRFASVQEAWMLPFVGSVRPWQLILIEVGAGGLLFTALLFTIREPARTGAGRQGIPLSGVLAFVRRNRRAMLCHHLGFAFIAVAALSGAAWIPEMFRRNFHWSIPQFSLHFGLSVAVCGSAGAVIAGRIADGMLRRGTVDANLRVAVWVALLAIPVTALMLLAPSGTWATVWMGPSAALVSAPYGIAAAALQQMLPGAMRGQLTALYLLTVNLIGATTGPTLVAVLTQHVFRREDSLHYSLLIVHVAAFAAAAALLLTARKPFLETVRQTRDLP
ncbi:MAG: MFS transporter [Bryobacteraceae bacterium]|nr:MFS transporter [Bryobacteraceae bacterium]